MKNSINEGLIYGLSLSSLPSRSDWEHREQETALKIASKKRWLQGFEAKTRNKGSLEIQILCDIIEFQKASGLN